MDSTTELVNFISSLLDSGNCKEALVALNEKRKEPFSDYCYEVVAAVVGKIQDDTIILKPSLHGACEQIISAVLDKCSPEDALLEFIERLELSKNDAQFGIVLPVIQKLLKKVMVNKKRSIEWSLYAISNYIEKIKITEHHLEKDERKLIDNDPNVRRLTKVYTMVIPFYQPFIEDILAAEDNSHSKTKQIVSEFLISLLGKPMILVDVDPDGNAASEMRQACQTIIQDICKLEKNVLKFLKDLEYKEKNRTRYTDGNELSPFETSDRMNMSTYSGFFYVAYSGHFDLPESAIPQVYKTEYVVHTLMLAVNHLLKFEEYGPLAKALALYQALNTRMCDNTSHCLLSSSVHFEMCKRLVKVVIHCRYQSLRKRALLLITSHIKKFDYKGRYVLLKYLIDTCNHSGMIGYTINLYKDTLIEALKDPLLNECFKTVWLSAMIKKMCYLPHGAESDLIELADQIITALNFLRFVILKDKDNITGIKEIIPIIETEYLGVLVTALNMSKAHYELKLKDLMEGKNTPSVKLNIGRAIMDAIPPVKKKEIIESALNAFHLMEGLISRLKECIKSYLVAE